MDVIGKQFLSILSHDVRLPLRVIAKMSVLPETDETDMGKLRDRMEKIHVSANYLLSMMSGVLDISKIESGKTELTEEVFSLREMMREVMEIACSYAPGRRQDIHCEMGKLRHETVFGDKQKLMRVMLNLVSNALKFSGGGSEIRMETEEIFCDEEDYGFFEFRVKDNGIGMEEAFLQRIYEPFARENNRKTAQIPGNGLGMTIVYQIVKMMKGEIRVDSKPGEGTDFRVRIPLRLS